MNTLWKIPVLFFGMIAVFFCLGSFFSGNGRENDGHVGETVLFGYITYYFLFELVSVPMMLLGAELRLLTGVWMAVLGVILVYSVCRHHGIWKKWWNNRGCFLKGKTVSFYLMLLLIALQVYYVAALQENGSADAAYYVGSVATNLATNSISSFDPYTGKALEYLNIRYAFSMYPAANSVLCSITGLHPLVVTKVVQSAMTVILSYLVYAQIGKALLKEKKQVWIMLCFISIVNLNFHTIYSNASFLLTRGYEGKAILSNVILPFVFYLGIRMYQEKKTGGIWLLFFETGVAAIDLTMSAMMIVPVAMGAVILPNIVRSRKWSRLGSLILVTLPCIVVLGIYLLGIRGYLNFPTGR